MRTVIDDYVNEMVDEVRGDVSWPGDYWATRELDDEHTGGITKDVAFNRMSFDGGEVPGPQNRGGVLVGDDEIQVVLVQPIQEDQFRTTLSMAINATRGIDPHNPPEPADWEEMLQGGLQTALETQTICFAVAGVSRAETHQAVRSRKAGFHQQSMRAHYYGEQPDFRMPESVWSKPVVREAWFAAMAHTHYAYALAAGADVSYQDARYILPEGTVNFILHEYTVREFLNVYAYRACSMFQWEIVSVMRKMREALIAVHPWMEPYVKISCEKTKGALDGNADEASMTHGGSMDNDIGTYDHHCTFQGWEEVDGQCDFPWARETNRAFRSERHAITRKKEILDHEPAERTDAKCGEDNAWGGGPPSWCELPKGHKGPHSWEEDR